MSVGPPCQLLAWDTEFFGRRIARVQEERFSPDRAAEALAWASARAVDCLYLLVDAADVESIRAAEDAGFRMMDVRVTRARAAQPDLGPGVGVEPFRSGDLPALRALARESFRATRFWVDPEFPDELCAALYERWIESSCAGEADAVLVAREGSCVSGLVTCIREAPDAGSIGLIATAPEWRHQGVGGRLVEGALAWFAKRAVGRVRIVTQARNLTVTRLLEGRGFHTEAVQHWYHWWAPAREGT